MNRKALFLLLRPNQWIKNLLLLFPPFFAGNIASPHVAATVVPALFSFCAAASASYIINDVRDMEADRNHREKRRRPLASGNISITTAVIVAVVLLAAAVEASLLVSSEFWRYVAAYLVISLSYTFLFKDAVIFDIFVISSGFLIRVLAGGNAFRVEVSEWLFLSVFIVALFLATGKRLGELITLGDNAHSHRRSLEEYTEHFLEGVLWFSASAALITYALYTIEQKSGLFYTVPLAAFGLLRYIYIVKEGKGDPTEALLKDGQILGVGVIWAVSIGVVIYG